MPNDQIPASSVVAAPPEISVPTARKHGPQKLSDWHKALSDFLLANPTMSRKQVAEFFKVSQPWLSLVTNSDAFMEYHQRRRDEMSGLLQDRLTAGLADGVTTLTTLAVEAVTDRVLREGETMSVRDITGIAKLGLEALGFGSSGRGSTVNVDIHNTNTGFADNRRITINDDDALQRSKRRLQELRAKNDADLKLLEA